MKKMRNINWKFLNKIIIGSFFAFNIILFSCEEKFLETEPIDIYSPQNSYVTAEDYESAVYHLHTQVRDYFGEYKKNYKIAMVEGTDMAYSRWAGDGNPFIDMSNYLTPVNPDVYDFLWKLAYEIIYNSNVIVTRAPAADNELTDQEKTEFIAEARLFRGYMYKKLANLYGGVPLVLEETRSPKRDFERASRVQVYDQAAADLKFAAENLGAIDEVPDSRANNLAAYHLLSEVYVCLERYEDAIDAASEVIDHPDTHLMTERFGTYKDVETCMLDDYKTNVYWDLFKKGNQNRSQGNKEAIWVMQWASEDPFADGGSFGMFMERTFAPRLYRVKVVNNDGTVANIVPSLNAYYGGNGSAYCRLSYWFFQTLWEKDGWSGNNWSGDTLAPRQDIRNAPCNIVRDFKVRNSASDYNGQWVLKDNLPAVLSGMEDTIRNFYPWVMKTSTPEDKWPGAWVEDPIVEGEINDSRHNFRDDYEIRLAETYLLRAEAYLRNDNPSAAAADINVVRNRAKAPLIGNPGYISEGDLDIDYILDERARELHLEESRLLLLARMGKLVERANATVPSHRYESHNNLWPIPYSEIEKNTGNELEQNPDY